VCGGVGGEGGEVQAGGCLCGWEEYLGEYLSSSERVAAREGKGICVGVAGGGTTWGGGGYG
jgi:hypothetical protein